MAHQLKIFVAAGMLAMSCTAANAQGAFQPFDLGTVMMQAEQIKAARQQQQLMQLQIDAQTRQMAAEEKRQEKARETSTDVSADDKAVLEHYWKAIKYRRYHWPDFDQVVFRDNVHITMDMLGLMAETDHAADLTYYLATHADSTAYISQLSLPDAAKALRSIEDMLTAAENAKP
jgi:hypothetical protein